jgi:glyoxylase-like metal-dependent hydrolase (beta-lactamase superfamily II)
VQWLLESHVHADHLSAAPYIQEQLGGKIGIGERITVVQDTFGKVFNEGTEFQRDGSQFDMLFHEGDSFHIGQMRGDVLHTPGHTPACLTYVIGDAAFVGDTLFMPDFGTARCDFPGGSSETLFDSVQKILALPDETRIFVGHDYKAPGREDYAWETTVGEQKALNVHVGAGKSKQDFVQMRDSRDATLAMPKLIIPSLQVNMRAGQMPPPDEKGDVFLKVPVNKL